MGRIMPRGGPAENERGIGRVDGLAAGRSAGRVVGAAGVAGRVVGATGVAGRVDGRLAGAAGRFMGRAAGAAGREAGSCSLGWAMGCTGRGGR